MGDWKKRYFIVGASVLIVALLAFLLGLQMQEFLWVNMTGFTKKQLKMYL